MNNSRHSKPHLQRSLMQMWLGIFVALFVSSPALAQDHAELFAPGVISTGDFESHPMFSPDCRTLYFLKSTPNFDLWTIVSSDSANGYWSGPSIASFSGQYSDADPFITADGSRLYFISNRPIVDTSGAELKDLDIWYVEKSGSDWGKPIRLDTTVNSPTNEWHPCVLPNGTIYFGSERPGGVGGCDIYRCRLENGKYLPAENLGDSINSKRYEFEPFVNADETMMLVMGGGRPDGHGGFDIYVSHKRDGVWSGLVNLGDQVNSPGNEYIARMTPDQKHLIWTSARGFADKPLERPLSYNELVGRIRGPQNGLGDIYQISIDAIPAMKP